MCSTATSGILCSCFSAPVPGVTACGRVAAGIVAATYQHVRRRDGVMIEAGAWPRVLRVAGIDRTRQITLKAHTQPSSAASNTRKFVHSTQRQLLAHVNSRVLLHSEICVSENPAVFGSWMSKAWIGCPPPHHEQCVKCRTVHKGRGTRQRMLFEPFLLTIKSGTQTVGNNLSKFVLST